MTPPPRAPAGLVPRDLGLPAPLPATVALVAGPGFGKTCALHGLVGPEAPCVWLALTPDDAAPAVFFRRLLAALDAVIPGLSEQAFLGPGDPAGAARDAWAGLCEALGAYGAPPWTLVLDDAHHLLAGGAPVLRGLAPRLAQLPGGMALRLASRRALPLPLRRLEAARVAALVEQPGLALRRDEAARLLAAREGAVPPDLDERLAASAGWPLGLAWGVTSAPGPAGRGWRAAVREVVQEVLDQLESPLAEALPALAVLGPCDAEAAGVLLGQPEAEALLEALVEHQLLEVTAAGYRVWAHLAEALREVARRELGAAAVAGLHRRAAAHLAAVAPELALDHALAGGELALAARLAEGLFPRWRFEERHGAIAEVLARLPREVATTEPLWVLWEGHLASWGGELPRALAAYEEAARLHAARGEPAGHFRALGRCLHVALVEHDMARAARLCEAAAGLLASAAPEDRADWGLAQAYMAEQGGDLAGMRRHNEAVLEVPIAGAPEVAASHAIARLNLHTQALHTGELAAAARHVAQARAVADAWRLTSYGVYGAVLEAHLALVRGDMEAAGAAFRALPGGWPRRLDWQDRACAHVMVAAWRQAEGALDEAEQALAEAGRLFAAAGYPAGQLLVAERAAWLALARQQPARAREAVAGLVPLGGGSLYEAALLLPRARAELASGDAAAAAATAAEAEAAFARLGAGLHGARAALYAAAADRLAGRGDAAAARLAAVRDLLAERGWGFLACEDAALWDLLGGDAAAPHGGPAGLTVRLLGSFEVLRDGVRVDAWERRRTQLLLAALVLYPHGLNVPELADVLGEAMAESKWRVAVSYLRQALEPGLAKGRASRFVTMVHDRYVLAPEGLALVDVRAFEAAIAAARAQRSLDPVAAARAYEEALGHHAGELLADPFFARYFEDAREQLRLQAVEARLWLSRWEADRGERRAAEAHVTAAMALAPADEHVALAAQAFFHAAHDATRAAQVYWDHRRARQLRFGLPASEAVEAAHRQALAPPARR
ncbi:MAG: hypothetical protein VKS61_14610 [Candidatus Sericytochromatia bacterium]|nr:hypothetical protein [Candidatus Sericytochromatia bacterium]